LGFLEKMVESREETSSERKDLKMKVTGEKIPLPE